MLASTPAAHDAAGSVRLLRAGAGVESLADYAAGGGYRAVDAAEVIDLAADAGIVGRGGAGFPLARKLAAVADDAGVSLIELAIAFVVNHPAVTSAIIGPRTMEQLDSLLPAAAVALEPAVLDRIDAIVRPGVTLNPADTSYGERVLQPAARRR